MTKQLTAQVKKALAKKFNVPEEDFVTLKVDGKTVVMLGGSGIHKGSWNDIMNAPAEDWTITVDGTSYDTRKGMTEAVFTAYIGYCKEHKITLPYSSTAKDWPWLLLTGEKLSDGFAPCGAVNDDGQVNFALVNPGLAGSFVRVAPAGVIEDFSSELDRRMNNG